MLPPTVRRIRAQQVEFQKLKKSSGNTFTARGMPVNIAACCVIIGCGLPLVLNNLYKVAYGRGKIVLEK